MSNLSELLPTGGGQNAVDFVASGTLSSGQTVVLNTNGTVSAAGISYVENPSAGTPAVFETGKTERISAAFDSSQNKIVVAYKDQGSSSYGTAVVGTISGDSISFGTPVVFKSASTQYTSITFDSNASKIVIAYNADSVGGEYGYGIVGTVSGTSISFGSETTFNADKSYSPVCVFDSNSNKIVVAYRDGGNFNYGTAVVGTVSGTSISFGSEYIFASVNMEYIGASFDSNQNVVIISYNNIDNSNYGTVIAGSVSGTALSFGTAVTFNAEETSYLSSAFDITNAKTVIGFVEKGASFTFYGKAIVVTASGTSLSVGSAVTFNSSATKYVSVGYDSNAGYILISYEDDGNSDYGTAVVGEVSGTSISFGSETVYEAAFTEFTASAFDSSANRFAILYKDQGNSNQGTGVAFKVTDESSNYTDFIGITAEAISDTATGAVNVYGGINEAQTGLTIGSDYYVQADGSISTTASSVKIGQAISATTINMMDLT